MSSINLNNVGGVYNNFTKSYETKTNSTAGQTFADKMIQTAESKATEVSKTGEVSTKDMVMDEYKQYIHDKISQIPLHPSRRLESISLNITDAGFDAMKNDPEYEAWVLNDLRVGWSQPNAWTEICGGSFSTIHYGATKEECHAEGWYSGYQNGNGEKLFNEKAGDSFWERRVNQHRENMDMQIEHAAMKTRLLSSIQTKYTDSNLLSGVWADSNANASYKFAGMMSWQEKSGIASGNINLTSSKENKVYLKTDDMLYSGGNGTGLSFYIEYAENSTEDNPIMIAKGVDENGNEFERTIDVKNINPENATIVEMRALEAYLNVDKGGGLSSLPISMSNMKLNDKANFLNGLTKTIDEQTMLHQHQRAKFYLDNMQAYYYFLNSKKGI